MSKRYKVAFITNIPTPYKIPLFERLARHPSIDFKVYFTAVSAKNRTWVVDLGDKFKYRILPGFTLNYQRKDLITYHVNSSIIKELKRSNYDVVIAGGYYSFTTQAAFFLSKLRNSPFILRFGSTEFESGFLRKFSLPLIGLIRKYTDAFIAYSSRSKKYLISLGVSPEKIFVSPNTIDVNFFKEESLKYRPQKKKLKMQLKIDKEKIILFVGQLIQRKGAKYLIRAYEKLRRERDDVALVIIGNGQQKKELMNLCTRDKIKDVYFTGFVKRKLLPLYYSISDVFVLPSLKEPFGLVINEAMACGLPIISTYKTGASFDLVKEGVNGYIVKEKDSKSLYKAIKKILMNPDLERSMGIISQKIIEETFTLEHSVKGWIDAISYVLSKRIQRINSNEKSDDALARTKRRRHRRA